MSIRAELLDYDLDQLEKICSLSPAYDIDEKDGDISLATKNDSSWQSLSNEEKKNFLDKDLNDIYNQSWVTRIQNGEIIGDWNFGLAQACEDGNKELVLLMISHGANNWDWGMAGACSGGHRDLVLLMISYGTRSVKGLQAEQDLEWNRGMVCACRRGHKDIILLMIEKGADNWEDGLYEACRGGYLEIVILIESISRKTSSVGTNLIFDWNLYLENACFRGHKDMVLYLIGRGADNWNGGLECSRMGGHGELILLMIEKGANIGDTYLSNNYVYYLVQKGITQLGKYQDVAEVFKETQTDLQIILEHILIRDLVSIILIY